MKGPIDQTSAQTWICSVNANENTTVVSKSKWKMEMMENRCTNSEILSRMLGYRHFENNFQCLSTKHTNEMCAKKVCASVSGSAVSRSHTPRDDVVMFVPSDVLAFSSFCLSLVYHDNSCPQHQNPRICCYGVIQENSMTTRTRTTFDPVHGSRDLSKKDHHEPH